MSAGLSAVRMQWILIACMLPMAAVAAPLSSRTMQCIVGASQYHRVSPEVMQAIVMHESRGVASTVSANSNGSVDIGLTGINSIHLSELAKKGVAPANLLDECVSVYVGAWKYSQKMYRHGNTWQAIGAYHSETPYYNQIYQAKIFNQMVDLGFIRDSKIVVPKAGR